MAMFDVKNPGQMIESVIMLSVAVLVLAAVVPTVLTAFTNLSGVANLPFASFYATGGAAITLLGAAVLLGIFAVIRGKRSGR